MTQIANFLRYPGSKRRMLDFLLERLPKASQIEGDFVEPFLGGGAVYFAVAPKRAIVGDINVELVDLYRGILQSPDRVWRLYKSFPTTKDGYASIRALNTRKLTILQRAARSLFLNRTCFKGMWRHNKSGQFNIGYGGQDRRWSISRADLFEVSQLLSPAKIDCCDFEGMIDGTRSTDFIFLDPPYRPGQREERHQHYSSQNFTFCDHTRLAASLIRASARNVRWAITISSHPDITELYKSFEAIPIPRGTGSMIGGRASACGEVLVTNN